MKCIISTAAAVTWPYFKLLESDQMMGTPAESDYYRLRLD